VDDNTAKILSQVILLTSDSSPPSHLLPKGLTKSSEIMSVDLSFNPIGSTGAAWITRATGRLYPPPPPPSPLTHCPIGDLFFDHFGLSTVPVKSYAVDML
jgi:hypothetical protein